MAKIIICRNFCSGNGYGDGDGDGNGNGYGNGDGNGYGDGYGYGYGNIESLFLDDIGNIIFYTEGK